MILALLFLPSLSNGYYLNNLKSLPTTTVSSSSSISHQHSLIRTRRKNGQINMELEWMRSDSIRPYSVQKSAIGVHGGGEVDGLGAQQKRMDQVQKFISKNFFLLGMFCAVSLARLGSKLGVDGGILRPELFIGKYGVFFIFLLSGLSLEVSELKHAIGNTKLNFLIQFTSFVAWPFLVGLPLVRVMGSYIPQITGKGALLPQPLLDGLLILTCLPTTVNMCIFLTSAANGSTASALCNAALGNLLGIFATPALLLRFFGTSIELPFAAMVTKLVNKVLIPVSIGQMLRTTKAKELYDKNKQVFKRTQEVSIFFV